MNASRTLRFSQLDSWFFRESRPIDSAGASQLGSLFPPPVRTLAGAVRTQLGERQGVDWRDFAKGDKASQETSRRLHQQMGLGDDLGTLKLQGPWLNLDGKRLYPAPLFLLRHPQSNSLRRLRIGGPVYCDLGATEDGHRWPVRLPAAPPNSGGVKTAENLWLDAEQYARCLAGHVPTAWVGLDRLPTPEPRLGIALDRTSRTVREGLLYQTEHLRLADDLAVDLDIAGLSDWPKDTLALRLGGEGRAAFVEPVATPARPDTPVANGDTFGLMLTLLTPADLGPTPNQTPADIPWLPPGFQADQRSGIRCWRGEIHGLALTIHAAVIGKPLRQGGWDQAKAAPRAVQSLLPAGSCWYVTSSVPLQTVISTLSNKQIGRNQALGFGQLAVALWQQNENQSGVEKP